ncbi:MAG: phosphoribosylglycinamide formyltransferase, partial [Candidatus Latescibacteria bacterium]|nr:phosphoribosylglycinamide formyltransferase [Candidatus Latescibacterota bacterium]
QSGALERARNANLPVAHLSSVTHPESDALDRAIENVLVQYGVNLVVLAGYMKKLGPRVLAAFSNRIINIHPALLPAFGGRGMYGERVHQAVIECRAQFSGATVHLVNEEYDQGPILLQEIVRVLPDDTPETLAARVLEVEHRLFPAAVGLFAEMPLSQST